jgi:hypothetical protein
MHLEMSFQPTVQIITIVRRSVMSLYERVLGDADMSARVGLATHELLENVLRHSVGGDTTLQIRTTTDTPAQVIIETRNRAGQHSIDTLKAHAAAMVGCDPQVYYNSVMTACALSDDDGGLGLARIRAEAEMLVDVKADGESVRIIATTIGAEA